MNRPKWLLPAGGGFVLLLVGVLAWKFLSPAEAPPIDVPPPSDSGIAVPENPETPVVTAEYSVYFPGSDGRLHAEVRELPASLSPADRLTALAGILVEGPLTDPEGAFSGLWRPLPEGTVLTRTYLLDDGRAIIDLAPPPLEEDGSPGPPPQMGSSQEILLAYSLANTILLNLEEADGLIVLWQGKQPATLAGQLDATRPLTANPSLIAE